MSAQDHLNPLQFYHGTAHPFSPGDLIEPGHPGHYGIEGDKEFTFFSEHPARAQVYARQALARETYSPDKQERVYQVEPTGPYGRSRTGSDMQSKHPLTVIREVK